MSSPESSGAPAEATATPSAPAAAFPTFGSTRGSGLARGKRPTVGPAAPTAAATEYTPTAIEVVNAPREYQNPFAPAEEPAAAAQTAPVIATPAPAAVAPVRAEPAASAQSAEPAALNILEPAQPKTAPAQTWESEGFKPAREPRPDRAPREERNERPAREIPADEPMDPASIPPQFLYVRPGHTYVPTPRNMGGAPRERSERSERPAHGSPERALETTAAPAKSGGFFGWLKSLFGGLSAAPVAASSGPNGEHRHEGSHRRHRGGRNRGGHGGGGGEGGQRRDRGGRGRSGGGYRGERSEGSRQGGV